MRTLTSQFTYLFLQEAAPDGPKRLREAKASRTMNTDPREQPPRQIVPTIRKIFSSRGSDLLKHSERRPPGRRSRHVRIRAIVILLFFMVGAGLLLPRFGSGHLQFIEMSYFTMQGYPQIIVDNESGSVHLRGDSSGNGITVQETKWSSDIWRNTDRVLYEPSRDGHTVTVMVERSSAMASFVKANRTDLDITIPPHANLRITTSNGTIAASNIRDQMFLTSDTGMITVGQSALQGNSTLQAHVGSVAFNGAVDRQGTDVFLTDTGPIDVTVPKSSTLQVDSRNSDGAILTDFPEVFVKRFGPVDIEAFGYTGTPPRAMMILRSTTGTITLHTGP